MEIALGVSMTSTTVHMVLVEGDKADGLTIECDQFATTAALETPAPSISEQVGAAVLATQQSARRQGHHLGTSGIAVSSEGDADGLRTSLAARGVDDVILVGELQAAAALAHAVGRAVGYSATGLLFVKQRKATFCIVNSVDRSMVEVLSRSFIDADPAAVLTEMLAKPPAQEPQGLFVVGAGEGAPAIKSRLEAATSLPIIFPEEPDWALARGAALAAATAPRFEASTSGLAYAQDPDDDDFVGPDAMPTGSLAPADVVTKHAVVDDIDGGVTRISAEPAAPRRQRFVPAGSLAASAIVIGIVAVVMAMAVSNAPTSSQHVLEQRQILSTEPSTAAPPAPPVIQAAPVTNPLPEQQAPAVPVPAPVQPPPPATKTVLVEQAPRAVATPAPARRAQTWAQPVAEAQAPAVAPPAAAPIHVDPPAAAAPAPAADPPPVAAPAPQLPAVAPSPALPSLSALMPRIAAAPIDPAPAATPQAPILRWLPRLQWPQPPQAPQQISQSEWPQQTSQWPQQSSQWPQQAPQAPEQISQWPQQAPQSQWPQQAPQQISQWPRQKSQSEWPQQAPQQTSQWPQQAPQQTSQWPQQSSQSQWPQQTSQWPQQSSQLPLWPTR